MEDFRQHRLIDDDQRRLTNAYGWKTKNNILILLEVLRAEVRDSNEPESTADSCQSNKHSSPDELSNDTFRMPLY
jgi:hypothetical protein